MTINFKSNFCILQGDSHGLRNIYWSIDKIPNNSDLIHLGDIGLGFSTEESDLQNLTEINNRLINKNIRFFGLAGNHDNKKYWRNNHSFSNLFLIPDYTKAIFPNGKTALLVGGGISIDRFYRTEGKDYWKDEGTIYEKTNERFDYLFIHDAPDYFNHSTESIKRSSYSKLLDDDKDLFKDCLNQRNVISNIVQDTQPRFIFGAHFHNHVQEEKNGIKYRCLNIDELLELDTDKL